MTKIDNFTYKAKKYFSDNSKNYFPDNTKYNLFTDNTESYLRSKITKILMIFLTVKYTKRHFFSRMSRSITYKNLIIGFTFENLQH